MLVDSVQPRQSRPPADQERDTQRHHADGHQDEAGHERGLGEVEAGVIEGECPEVDAIEDGTAQIGTIEIGLGERQVGLALPNRRLGYFLGGLLLAGVAVPAEAASYYSAPLRTAARSLAVAAENNAGYDRNRYFGYWKPYATSHDELDRDECVRLLATVPVGRAPGAAPAFSTSSARISRP